MKIESTRQVPRMRNVVPEKVDGESRDSVAEDRFEKGRSKDEERLSILGGAIGAMVGAGNAAVLSFGGRDARDLLTWAPAFPGIAVGGFAGANLVGKAAERLVVNTFEDTGAQDIAMITLGLPAAIAGIGVGSGVVGGLTYGYQYGLSLLPAPLAIGL